MARTRAKSQPDPAPAANWRDRVLGLERISGRELGANPRNFRTHPEGQRAALSGVLEQVGVAGALLGYRDPEWGLTLIDGHLRREVGGDDREWPVLLLDVTRQEADLLLATHDPIGSMAGRDRDSLERLLREVQTPHQAVADLLTREAEFAGIFPGGDGQARPGQEPGSGHPGGTPADEPPGPSEIHPEAAVDPDATLNATLSLWQLRSDVYFPSANRLGIPELRPDRLAGPELIPRSTWVKGLGPEGGPYLFIHGANAFPAWAQRGGHCLGFYTDDYRFEAVWNGAVETAARFVTFGWGAAIAPDFSIWKGLPFAVEIWQTYRSRWVGRYWQELGIPVFPTINPNLTEGIPPEDQWLGVPRGAPAVWCQVRTSNKPEARRRAARGLRAAAEYLEPGHLVLYGGGESRKWLEPLLAEGGGDYPPIRPESTALHWIDSWNHAKRNRGGYDDGRQVVSA